MSLYSSVNSTQNCVWAMWNKQLPRNIDIGYSKFTKSVDQVVQGVNAAILVDSEFLHQEASSPTPNQEHYTVICTVS